MNSIIITKAVKEDLPVILDIQRKAFLEVAKTFHLKSMPQIEQTLESITDELNHCIFLKADIVKPPLKKINATSDKSIHLKLKSSKFLDSGLRRNDKGSIKIVGSVRAYSKDNTCYIHRLIVLPEYQNKGIGKSLMSAIENQFQNNAARYELFTGSRDQRNQYLYKQLGYKTFKTQKLNHGHETQASIGKGFCSKLWGLIPSALRGLYIAPLSFARGINSAYRYYCAVLVISEFH